MYSLKQNAVIWNPLRRLSEPKVHIRRHKSSPPSRNAVSATCSSRAAHRSSRCSSAKGWPTRCAWRSIPNCGSGPAGAALRSVSMCRPAPECRRERVGGMEVTHCTIHPDTTAEDLRWLGQAVEEGRRCTPSPSCYCVGAVVVTADGRSFTGYTHETSATHHAEQEAIRKAVDAGADLRGASMFSSMEPCSKRASEPESCTQLLLRHGFARAVFALYEPDCFVCCRGALTLREGGLDVRVYPRTGRGRAGRKRPPRRLKTGRNYPQKGSIMV